MNQIQAARRKRVHKQVPEHYKTPKRSKVKGVVEFFEKKGITLNTEVKEDIFTTMGVESLSTGYSILAGSCRTYHNDSETGELRGRKLIVTGAQVAEADKILEEATVDDEGMSWKTVGAEINTEAKFKTVRNTLQESMNWHKREPPLKDGREPRIPSMRIDFSKDMLQLRSNVEDWYNVLFSDEHHEGFGPTGRQLVIRKPGRARRIRPDNVQHTVQPSDKDKKRIHVWAVVGWNFRSKLFFYNVPINDNGKLTQAAYLNLLERPDGVKDWLASGKDFVLEEDRDSSHGTGKSNKIRAWKDVHDLKYYFNCADSPDLSLIENCWGVLHRHIANTVIWDDEHLKKEMEWAWEHLVTQEFINEQVKTMPQRLRDVITAEGAMTGW